MATTTESRSSKKKTKTTRKKTKKIDAAEAERLREEAVQRAIQEERERWEREQEEAGFEDIDDYEVQDEELETGEHQRSWLLGGENRFADGNLQNHNREEAEFNLFDWIEENYFRQGVAVTYYIKKNGQVMGEIEHPTSWTELQKTFGGGQYQVIAKTSENKTYIKSQRQMVAAPAKKDEDREPRYMPPPPAPEPREPSIDMNQMFTNMMGMFQQMQEMNEKARAREERDEKKSSDSFNTTFLTLMQNQQKSTSDMFLKIAEMTQKTSEQQSNNFSRVIEKMDDKFTRMFEKMSETSKQKEQLGLKDLLALTNSSRQEGLEQMKLIMELAEQRAESLRGDDDDDDSKGSLINNLIKGVLPIVAQARQSQMMMPPQQQMPRGAVPQSGVALPPSQRAKGPQSRPPQGTIDPRVAQARAQAGVGQGRQPSPELVQKAFTPDSLGLAGFREKNVEVNEPYIPEPYYPESQPETAVQEVGPENGVAGISAQEVQETPDQRGSNLYDEASLAQRTIAELAIPTIAIYMDDAKLSAENVGHIVMDELEAQGYTAKTVVKEFTFEFLLEVARAFGIGDERKPWFEEFYSAIQERAGTGVDGEEEHTSNEGL